MKVRLLDPGFENYTGHFGSIAFVDGVSDEVSQADAQRMGSVMRVEVVGTGENPSITQVMVDTRNQNMTDVGGNTKTLAELDAEAQAAKKKADANRKKLESEGGAKTGAEQNGGVPVDSPADLDFSYTIEQLKELVAKQGIAGLREFAEKYQVKGRAVKGIIEDLMKLKQDNQPKEPEAPAATATEGNDDDILLVGDEAGNAPAPEAPANADGFGATAPEGTEFIGDDDEPAPTEAPAEEAAPTAAETAEAPGTGEGFLDEDGNLDELEAELAALTEDKQE